MPFVIDAKKIRYASEAYKHNGQTQCPIIAQQAVPVKGSSRAPKTRFWRKGIRVKGARPMDIQRGTVIATFNSKGKYPSYKEGQLHTAIYLSHTSKGIWVVDQWQGKPTPSKRFLKFGKRTRDVNRGDFFYVVETQETLAAQKFEEQRLHDIKTGAL